MVATLQREQGIRPQDIALVVETDPGHVAQVDFGYAGRLWDPETKSLRRAWVFVMVLGYSRHLFAQIVFDQKTETWLRLHEEAFRAFGGVSSTTVPDYVARHVIREDHARHRAEEPPRRIQARAHRRGGLLERRPHELVAAVRERHHEHPQVANPLRRWVEQLTHQAEVDLRDLAGLGVRDANRRRLLAPRELLHGEAPERIVARADAVVALEQRVDLRQLQRPRLGEPGLDACAMRADPFPLLARVRHRTRLHALSDRVDLLVRRLAIGRQWQRRSGLEVPADRLAIEPRLARHVTRALPRRTTAEHFLDVNHDQLSVGHRPPPDGDPRRHRKEPVSDPDRGVPSWPHEAAKNLGSWPHDPAKNWVTPPRGWPHPPAFGVAP
ncbi:DDE-type integrase/transposase/recombinase [Sorangium sp. So ce315]